MEPNHQRTGVSLHDLYLTSKAEILKFGLRALPTNFSAENQKISR